MYTAEYHWIRRDGSNEIAVIGECETLEEAVAEVTDAPWEDVPAELFKTHWIIRGDGGAVICTAQYILMDDPMWALYPGLLLTFNGADRRLFVWEPKGESYEARLTGLV